MSELDKRKSQVIDSLKSLCEYCRRGERHNCPLGRVVWQIQNLRGIPIIVNDHLHHVMFTN